MSESFIAHVKGDASQFRFILADLYDVTKKAKTNDILKMGDFYFPLLPIRDMIRTCPDKMIRWDAKLTISDDNCPVLHVEFHDVVKTIVNFKGSCCLSDVKINPRSRTIQTVYEWELSRKFFAPFTTETAAEIATETPETAVQDTPQPDPVVLVTETPETTPEPEILAVPVPVAVFPTKTTPKPRKRRQTANVIKNDTFWALCRDIAKIILDEAKTAVIAR